MSRLGPHGQRAAELAELAGGHGELVLVEGERRCLDLIDRGLSPHQLIVSEGRLDLLPPALGRGPWEVLEAPFSLYAKIVGSRSLPGVSGVFARPQSSWETLAQGRLLLGIDGVQDPGNLGALIRVAAALGADGVLVGRGSARPWSVKSLRASAAAGFLVPVLEVPDWQEATAQGFAVATASAHGGKAPEAWEWSGRWLLLVGNEGHGSQGGGRPVTISLGRGVESLNVAVAAALLLVAIRPLLRLGVDRSGLASEG